MYVSLSVRLSFSISVFVAQHNANLVCRVPLATSNSIDENVFVTSCAGCIRTYITLMSTQKNLRVILWSEPLSRYKKLRNVMVEGLFYVTELVVVF